MAQVLELDNNRISYVSENTLQQLSASKTLTNLTLHNNPWQCDCQHQYFAEFLHNQTTNKKVSIERIKRWWIRWVTSSPAELDKKGLFILTKRCLNFFFVKIILHWYPLFITYWKSSPLDGFASRAAACWTLRRSVSPQKRIFLKNYSSRKTFYVRFHKNICSYPFYEKPIWTPRIHLAVFELVFHGFWRVFAW